MRQTFVCPELQELSGDALFVDVFTGDTMFTGSDLLKTEELSYLLKPAVTDRLIPCTLSKEDFKAYLRDYLKRLVACIQESSTEASNGMPADVFKAQAQALVNKLPRWAELQLFTGQSGDLSGGLVYKYFEDGSTAPVVLCWRHGVMQSRSSNSWPTLSQKRWEDFEPTQVAGRDDMLTLRGVLTGDECSRLIEHADRLGFAMQEQAESQGMAFRCHGRILIEDKALATLLWQRGDFSRLFAGERAPPTFSNRPVIGFNSSLKFYRYEGGERFGAHYDGVVTDGEGHKSEWTVLFYLSGGLHGGNTVFYKNKKANAVLASIQPEAGLVLLHPQGPRCLLHEALTVQRGVKYVLRTDVIVE